MSGACDRVLKDLPLYAEGELSPPEMRAISAHLESCPSCRDWRADYDEFTRKILEEESPAGEFRGPALIADDLADGGNADEPWKFPYRAGRSRTGGESGDAAFTARVMSDVRRVASRRTDRARRIAAAILVFSGVVLGGLAWLGGKRLGMEVAVRLPESPEPALAVPVRAVPVSVKSLAATPAPGPSLASAWWVIDPEREREAREAGSGREMETVLYARGSEGEDSANGSEADSREPGGREFVILKALLGAVREGSSGSRPGAADLLMVPEAEGGRDAIPLRPVAYPIRVPEREIAANTRIRIKTPAVRYRIVWVGNSGMPLLFSPVMRPIEPRSRGGFSLSPSPASTRLPAPTNERYSGISSPYSAAGSPSSITGREFSGSSGRASSQSWTISSAPK